MKQRAKTVTLIFALLFTAGLFFAYGAIHWGWWLPCIFREITGLQCPGCGVSRMCLALLRLDWHGAFAQNPAVFCMLPALLYLVGYMAYSYIRRGHIALRKWQSGLCYGLAIILLISSILRNLR